MENNNSINNEMTQSIEDALNEGLNQAAETVTDSYTPAPVPSTNVTPAVTGKNKTTIIVICVVAGVVTLGVGAFVAWKLWRKKHPKAEEGEAEAEE